MTTANATKPKAKALRTKCETSVRSAPLISAEVVIRKLAPNEEVRVIDKINHDWYVLTDGTYVYAPFLE